MVGPWRSLSNIVRGLDSTARTGAAVCLAVLLLAAGVARGGERRFTFVYEVDTNPPGTVEYEQWVTWKSHKGEDPEFDRIDFRHEIEFGITDHLQLGIYVADWRYEDGKSVEDDGVSYQSSAVELIYNISDPVTDPIGFALYGEFTAGDEVLGVEGKLLFQKNIDRFVLAYNLVLEAEWEGSGYSEKVGTFEQTAGISYQLMPSLLVGAELVHEVEFAEWQETGDNVVHVGPNVSYRAKQWWVTVTPLFQVTNLDGEPDFITRLIFGVNF
jgi:hypothetical protein